MQYTNKIRKILGSPTHQSVIFENQSSILFSCWLKRDTGAHENALFSLLWLLNRCYNTEPDFQQHCVKAHLAIIIFSAVRCESGSSSTDPFAFVVLSSMI